MQCTHILCSLVLFGEAFLYLLAIANPKDTAELRDIDAVRARSNYVPCSS